MVDVSHFLFFLVWLNTISTKLNEKKRYAHRCCSSDVHISFFLCCYWSQNLIGMSYYLVLSNLHYIVVKLRQCRSDLCYCSHTRRKITKDYNIKQLHCWLCNALWSARIVTEQYTVMSNLVQCDESQSRWLEIETQWRPVGRPKLSATSHSETKQATAL